MVEEEDGEKSPICLKFTSNGGGSTIARNTNRKDTESTNQNDSSGCKDGKTLDAYVLFMFCVLFGSCDDTLPTRPSVNLKFIKIYH